MSEEKSGRPHKSGKPVRSPAKPKVTKSRKSEVGSPNDLEMPNALMTNDQKMEVHHHPEVEKKGLKEYLLEGLMIFLAVTMGFFAESIREHISDENHIKQLTISLVADLKHDTLRLAKLIRITNVRQRNIDSLFFLLQRPMAGMDTYSLQKWVQAAANLTLFSSENGTITQLKNSGSLRLLGETKVPHYIGQYESVLNVTRALENIDVANAGQYINSFESRHFTLTNLFALSKTAIGLNAGFIPVDKSMRNITQESLTQFGADLMLCRQNSGYVLGYYLQDKEVATEFMQYLQKEYHLKDE